MVPASNYIVGNAYGEAQVKSRLRVQTKKATINRRVIVPARKIVCGWMFAQLNISSEVFRVWVIFTEWTSLTQTVMVQVSYVSFI